MPTVMLMRNNAFVLRLPLPEGETRLGRGFANHVRIDRAKVSRAHAILVRHGPFVTLRDLHSRNGSLVNGESVYVRSLVNGDVIQIADIEMVYFDADDCYAQVAEMKRRELPADTPFDSDGEAVGDSNFGDLGPAGQVAHGVHDAAGHASGEGSQGAGSLPARDRREAASTVLAGLDEIRPLAQRKLVAGFVGGARSAAESVSDGVAFSIPVEGREISALITYDALATHFGAYTYAPDGASRAVAAYQEYNLAIHVAASMRYALHHKEPVVLRSGDF